MYKLYSDLTYNINIIISFTKCNIVNDKFYILPFCKILQHIFDYNVRTNKNFKIVKYILTKAALKIKLTIGINCAIQYACISNNYKVVKLLLKDKRVNPIVHDNYSIKTACNRGYYKIVKYLLENVIPKIDPSINENLLIKRAIEYGYYKIVKYLLENAIPKIDPSINENFLIKTAIEHGYYKIVKYLLPKIDPTFCDNFLIKKAIRYQHIEIYKLLLKDERIKSTFLFN